MPSIRFGGDTGDDGERAALHSDIERLETAFERETTARALETLGENMETVVGLGYLLEGVATRPTGAHRSITSWANGSATRSTWPSERSGSPRRGERRHDGHHGG
jgi:hypothetical protein